MYWYNGQLQATQTLKLSIDEPALLYGATVFTTLRVYQATLEHPLTAWSLHCARLQESVTAFGWRSPNWDWVWQGAKALLPFFPVLRITLFPDGREWITGRALPVDLAKRQQQGITARVALPEPAILFQRSLPSHKTGNYLVAWLALQQAQSQGMQEAILVDLAGNWLETTTGNLWGWTQGQWWTPPLAAGLLPGVIRMQLMDWLQRHQQVVGEIPWSPDWVRQLEAIAYTNSVVELIPLRAVIIGEEQLAYSVDHPSFQKLRTYFQIEGDQTF